MSPPNSSSFVYCLILPSRNLYPLIRPSVDRATLKHFLHSPITDRDGSLSGTSSHHARPSMSRLTYSQAMSLLQASHWMRGQCGRSSSTIGHPLISTRK